MNPDDPKFTAHALGEFDDLTPAERAEIEALLASDPQAAAEAQETQVLATRLRAELPGEEAAALSDAQRAVVLGSAKTAAAKVVRFPWRRTVLSAAAACVIVGAAIALLFPAFLAEKAAVRRSLAADAAMPSSPDVWSDAPMSIALQPPAQVPPNLSQPTFSATTPQNTEQMALAKNDAGTLTLNTSSLIPAKEPSPTAPTAGQRPQVEQVEQLLVEADGFYQTGRFDLAKKRAEQTLALDPANQTAQKLGEKVDRTISDYGVAAYNETRADAVKQVELAWQRPIRRFNLPAATPAYTTDGIERRVAMTEQAASAPPATESPAPMRNRPEEPMGSIGRLQQLERSNTEAFDALTENAFLAARENPLSTFSIDVDTASYAIVRRFLNGNQRPPKGAVRIEELLNYFTYEHPQPKGDAPFSATMEVAACPWTPEHRLVRIGLKGREIAKDKRPASNLVFLIDVSGSMKPENKLPLLKQSLALLIEQLGGEDQVAMVVYAGSSGTVLEPTRDKEKMHAALRQLEAGGSTNGASGLQLAYQLAEKAFIKGGTNRVILATDGDWNVGVTSQSDLLDLIAQRAKSGVFLTVLGVGMGNLKDAMMVKLADRGNGNYAYLDTIAEARKVLVEQLSGTLVTIAKDVKVQVEFNPAQVGAYRLIGYEKRLLAKEDFNDDKKDAGEIGAGHTVTALYEVVLAGQPIPAAAPPVDVLKYQPKNVLLTKEWKAPSDLINVAAASVAASLSKTADRTLAKEWLMKRGVKFEGAASAIYIVRSTRLIVRNTRAQIDLIDDLLSAEERTAQESQLNRPDRPAPIIADTLAPEASEADSLRSEQKISAPAAAAAPTLPAAISRELLTLKLRYKEPEGDTSKLLEFPLTDSGAPWEQSSRDFRFAAAVAGYGMLLRDSPHKGQATWSGVAEWAQEGLGTDASGYRAEFLTLLEKAKALTR